MNNNALEALTAFVDSVIDQYVEAAEFQAVFDDGSDIQGPAEDGLEMKQEFRDLLNILVNSN